MNDIIPEDADLDVVLAINSDPHVVECRLALATLLVASTDSPTPVYTAEQMAYRTLQLAILVRHKHPELPEDVTIEEIGKIIAAQVQTAAMWIRTRNQSQHLN